MSFNYEKYRDIAMSRLSRYGQDIEILSPDLEVTSIQKAISSPINLMKIPDTLVDKVSKHMTCTACYITNDSYVRWNDVVYKVYDVSPVNLANCMIAVQFYIGA